MRWESYGIDWPAASMVRPFGLAAPAWLLRRVLGVRHPATRHAIWTAVLAGMMLLPAVSVVAPQWKPRVLPRREAAALTDAARRRSVFECRHPRLDFAGNI